MAQFVLKNDAFDHRTIVVHIDSGCPYKRAESGGELVGNNLFTDIPVAAEGILTADDLQAFRGLPGNAEHSLKHSGFFISQEKNGPAKEHRFAGCECGEDEVCQFVKADGGQHGITELIQKRQFSNLFGGCSLLRGNTVCHRHAPAAEGERSEKSGAAFFLFLFHFAVDAECCDRPDLEARLADLVAAFLADSEIPAVNPVKWHL